MAACIECVGSGLPVRIEADGLTAYGSYTDRDRDEVAHLLGAGFDIDAFARAFPALAARAPDFGRRYWPIRSKRW